MEETNDIVWLEPWEKPLTWTIPDLEKELKLEIGPAHPLWGVNARAVGRRADQDDVLFLLKGYEHQYAVVHLIWNGKVDSRPADYPLTTFYHSLEEWVEKCMKTDNAEFEAGAAVPERILTPTIVLEYLKQNGFAITKAPILDQDLAFGFSMGFMKNGIDLEFSFWQTGLGDLTWLKPDENELHDLHFEELTEDFKSVIEAIEKIFSET